MTPSPDEQRPVVRRVVKRTVIRPVQSAPAGRKRHSVPTVRLPAPVRATTTATLSKPVRAATQTATTTASRAGWAIHDAIWDIWDDVRAWRIPQRPPLAAAAWTGLLCGLTVTALGTALLAFFEVTRGTSTGGGLWGGLSVVGLCTLCWTLSGSLLRQFGSATPSATSALGVILGLVLTLTFFTDLTNSAWAALVVPLVTVVSYVTASLLIDILTHAESLD